MVSVRIPLVNSNLFARVSIQDAERVMSHNWTIVRVQKSEICYATTGRYDIASKKMRTVYMHRFVTNAQRGKGVDHRDRDGLNNVQSNLRPADQSQNAANQKKRSTNTSGYRGVSFCKRTGRWEAYIMFAYKQKGLGHFSTKGEAALAYNEEAIRLFGEFATLNQVEP